MFTLFFRGMILYIAMIFTMRALGKRQLGQFQPYEFAMTILLADVISAPMESVSTPLLHGLLPVAAMIVVYGVITLCSMKSDRLRAFFSGKPAVVVRRGEIDRAELNRLCMSVSDLLEGLRGAGFLDPADVGTAIVEANGSISAFAKSEERPPTAREMGVSTPYEGMPLVLIMDGRIQPDNLRATGKDEAWLNRLLKARSLTVETVFFSSLNTEGKMLIQPMTGEIEMLRAMNEGEVGW